ncbi:hypothetical protein FACS1894176_01810 [Bacteroidia bacterium]|nr:hypothetical protein FACS1894176_01810 [Bacteroidia bacterium]
MAKNSGIRKISSTNIRKLIYSKTFYSNLLDVLEYGREQFGNKVVADFYKDILRQTARLPQMPDRYPICRFMESTQKKTYRNILIRKYYIVYCVKSSEIVVLDILHQSMSPENIVKMIRKSEDE